LKGNAKGQIFWLDGAAGTGKSIIAQTITNRFYERKELSASFFCSYVETTTETDYRARWHYGAQSDISTMHHRHRHIGRV